MKEIVLTQDKVALVDDNTFEMLNKFKWFAQKSDNTYYACRMLPRINGKHPQIKMHHVVIGKPPKGFKTDHKNGNGLHNFKNNLRHVTNRQNCQNRKNANDSSQYPGIYWHKQREKWCARIWSNGKMNHLGYFKVEINAFNAYKRAVETLGEEMLQDEIIGVSI